MNGEPASTSHPPNAEGPLGGGPAEDVDALIRVYQEKLRYYEELSRTRPGLDGQAPLDPRLLSPPDAASATLDPTTLDPAARAAVEQLTRISQDPRFQRAVEVLSDPILQTHARALVESGQATHLLYAQAAWALVIMMLKAWRLSRARVWHQRLGVRIWTSGLYWMGALMGLPLVIYGKPYLQLVARLIELLAPRS